MLLSRSQSTARVPSWRAGVVFGLSLFLAMLFIVGAIFAWSWMQKPTSFPIKQVEVRGVLTHESPMQIAEIIRTHLTGGFFSLNVSGVKQAILSFPWVQQVAFRRVWPSTLQVHIEEQQAVARFGKTGVLNNDGKVFYPSVSTLPENLPDLEGPQDQSAAMLSFYRTADTLSRLLGLSIVSLHVNAENSWNLRLSNQLAVTLGRQNPLARFQQFVAVYPKIVALSKKRTMVSVNCDYPDGFAVAYADGSNKVANTS